MHLAPTIEFAQQGLERASKYAQGVFNLRRGRSRTKLNALAKFTATMVASRGRPTEADVAAFLAAGYSEKDILGIIPAIGVKTFSNYANHVFHTPVDDMFATRLWKAA